MLKVNSGVLLNLMMTLFAFPKSSVKLDLSFAGNYVLAHECKINLSLKKKTFSSNSIQTDDDRSL